VLVSGFSIPFLLFGLLFLLIAILSPGEQKPPPGEFGFGVVIGLIFLAVGAGMVFGPAAAVWHGRRVRSRREEAGTIAEESSGFPYLPACVFFVSLIVTIVGWGVCSISSPRSVVHLLLAIFTLLAVVALKWLSRALSKSANLACFRLRLSQVPVPRDQRVTWRLTDPLGLLKYPRAELLWVDEELTAVADDQTDWQATRISSGQVELTKEAGAYRGSLLISNHAPNNVVEEGWWRRRRCILRVRDERRTLRFVLPIADR
jgi:MFS family permease